MNREEVGVLSVESVGKVGCFVVVGWGIFGFGVRGFFRMSVVE